MCRLNLILLKKLEVCILGSFHCFFGGDDNSLCLF